MASLCKPTFSKAIPKGAKIVRRNRKKFAQFKHKGKTIEAPLTKDGKKCRIPSDKWYVRYKDANGKWQEVAAYTDKTASQKKAVEIQQRIDRRLSGHSDPCEDHHARPLLDHLEDFEQYLRDKNVSDTHRSASRRQLSPPVGSSESATYRRPKWSRSWPTVGQLDQPRRSRHLARSLLTQPSPRPLGSP